MSVTIELPCCALQMTCPLLATHSYSWFQKEVAWQSTNQQDCKKKFCNAHHYLYGARQHYARKDSVHNQKTVKRALRSLTYESDFFLSVTRNGSIHCIRTESQFQSFREEKIFWDPKVILTMEHLSSESISLRESVEYWKAKATKSLTFGSTLQAGMKVIVGAYPGEPWYVGVLLEKQANRWKIQFDDGEISFHELSHILAIWNPEAFITKEFCFLTWCKEAAFTCNPTK